MRKRQPIEKAASFTSGIRALTQSTGFETKVRMLHFWRKVNRFFCLLKYQVFVVTPARVELAFPGFESSALSV